ncbi:ExbD/TolR family protein [Aestuariispira insulae]|uniref:Outer membrane transport energization protein ExbD n=1 Tax=Aestuariispira insulae TaxID=1461337 RepID=A0A3D9H3T2_9PROT|nr:biopolymer transporter ExbD [Aestuariispira insulae]RED44163.1 outer membrane transport energization protein ExbD [Aestuariispira insulae]
MKLPDKDQSEPIGENTLPMINIVFLLLIFFMIAGSLQNSMPFDMDPLKGTGDRPGSDTPLLLYVSQAGEFSYQGRLVTEAEFVAVIEEQISETQAPPTIQIKSDQSSNSRVIIGLLTRLGTAGVSQVTLAVVE